MAKKNQLQLAIDHLEAEKAVLQLAIDRLVRQAQQTKTPTRKVKRPPTIMRELQDSLGIKAG